MQRKFVKFPNGKMWAVDENGWIRGTVCVPEYEQISDLEGRLDAIAEAATGSVVGLTGFSYQYRGNDLISFSGAAEELPSLDDEAFEGEGYELLEVGSEEFKACLVRQYGITLVEAEHAASGVELDYSDECVIDILGSCRQLRTPAAPVDCEYVRVTVDEFELAYWTADEWRDDPSGVMGAIAGAVANGGRTQA